MKNNRIYTVGELAKISGTTVRTIQYYDTIDLLVAKRQKNSNSRYYTQADLFTLQQILFYKKLGIPLKHIKQHLVNTQNITKIKELLNRQADILFQQEMEIKMNLAIIEAIVATLDTKGNDDLEAMIKVAIGLNKQSILHYATIDFEQETNDVFYQKEINQDDVLEVYWHWKKLVLEATFLTLNHTPPKSKEGYQFAKKWHEFVTHATNNDPEMIQAYKEGRQKNDQWPEEDMFLYHFCDMFIEESLQYYDEKGGTP